jgi:hypothetical protein
LLNLECPTVNSDIAGCLKIGQLRHNVALLAASESFCFSYFLECIHENADMPGTRREMQHVLEKLPGVAKQMEQMHNEDPKRWVKEMRPKWDVAPET